MQALGFVFLVLATLIYASGDAQLAKEAMQAELDEERDSEGGGDGAAPSTRSPMMAPVEEDRPMPGVGVSPRASPIDSYSESSAVSIQPSRSTSYFQIKRLDGKGGHMAIFWQPATSLLRHFQRRALVITVKAVFRWS